MKMKKLLCMLLAVALVCGLLPTMALAAGPYSFSIISEGGTFAENGFQVEYEEWDGYETFKPDADGKILLDSKVYDEEEEEPNLCVYIKRTDGGIITADYLKEKVAGITINDAGFDFNSADMTSKAYTFNSGSAGVGLKFFIQPAGRLRIMLYGDQFGSVKCDIVIKFVFQFAQSNFTLTTLSEDESKGTVTQSPTSNENEYSVTATPEPGYAFEKWQYRTYSIGNDTQPVYTPAEGWADYTELTAASGTVTVTANTEFQACFVPASIKLVSMELGATEAVTSRQWAPTNPNAAADSIDSGGFDASSLTQAVTGTPGIGDAAKLAFQWGPVGLVQGPNSAYYRASSKWGEFSAADNTRITMMLYAGAEASGTPVFEKTTTLWVNGNTNQDPTGTVSGTWTGWGAITFLMPENGKLTLSVGINDQTPSTMTLSVFDDAQLAALKELKSGYEGYRNTTGLSAAQIEQLDGFYQQAKNDILAATDAETITAKKTAALEEMAAVLVSGGCGLHVAVSVEAFTLEKGLIVQPTLVEITDGTKVYTAIRRALAAAYPNVETSALTTGSTDYIAAVYLPGYTGTTNGANYLGEKDNGDQSGWVYCVDSTFPGVGVGTYTLSGGETIRLQYTVNGYGNDVKPASDKDELIMTVAQLRALYTDAQLTGTAEGLTAAQTTAYNNAFALVNTLFVDAAEADAKNTALREAFGNVFAPVDPDVKAVIDLIKAIGPVSRLSGPAIEAAEAAYAALTPEQQAEVYNYAKLTQARADYDALIQTAAPTPAEALAGVLDYLKTNVTAPAVGSTNGEWAVLALARGGAMTDAIKAAYLGNLNTKLADTASPMTKWTDFERVTLALSALGIDATAYGETPADLTASYKTYTAPGQRIAADQTLNTDVFALLALNAKPYDGEQDQYITALCNAALDDGWNLDPAATTADVDMTAMAIQALAPYYSTNSTVKAKVDAALAWLKTQQDPYSGGFMAFGGSVVSTCSTAQVVTALCALGIDPAGAAWTVNGMTPLSGLTLWYNEKGWFGETDTAKNQMSTEQAAYALVAWDRFTQNKTGLYDMRDVFPAPKSSDAGVTSVTVKGEAATAGENNSFTAELPAGTNLAALTAADFTIRPATGAAVSGLATADSGENWTFTVTAEDGTTKQDYTVALTVAAPSGGGGTGTDKTANEAAVAAAKAKIPATLTASYTEVSNAANAKSFVLKALGALELDESVSRSVEITAVTAAVAGSAANPAGTPGSFTATVTLSKGEGDAKAEDTATIAGTITPAGYVDPSNKITVSFRLIGAEKAAKDVDLGATPAYLPDYVTWVPTVSYTLSAGATVYDLWTAATAEAGIESVGAEDDYVKTVYAPDDLGGYALSEFTNGARSGWMYTVNGKHPNRGLKNWELESGDVVVWHYVNDYSYEVADWVSDGQWQALGDGTYYNQWLKAGDSYGAKGGGVGNESGGSAGGSGSGGSSDSNTVTADDGSQVSTETEKTVETKTNDDGSVTETVTETTTTTVTAPDGSVSVTETAVETETTTNSVKNPDGSVTETEKTVEKVTETTTGADGTKQTVVTETAETKEIKTTTGADGKVSGTGTYSATTTVTGADGKKTTAVTEGNVVVDTDDAGTVSEVTTAKTTTTAPDGTKTETVTVITEAEMANGTTGKVVADEQGNTISAEATVSKAALEAAAKSGEPIEIPVTVNAASGATVKISLEGAGEDGKLWVEIGTTSLSSGFVGVMKLVGGATKLLTNCKSGSVIVPVTGDCEVIIMDNSKSFSDVDGAAWYGDSVTFVTAREIFNGNGDGTFAPGATMNRAMAAQILYNLDGEAKAGDGTAFSDVSASDWFNGAVGWAAGLGVINGYDGAYAPLDAVTRQDLVTILYRYAKQAGFDVSAGRSVDLSAYADGAAVASYAAEAMRWAIAVGLIKGYEDNTLRPTATATRAEVAAIMRRMVQRAVK